MTQEEAIIAIVDDAAAICEGMPFLPPERLLKLRLPVLEPTDAKPSL